MHLHPSAKTRRNNKNSPVVVSADDRLYPRDVASFWRETSRWMWRASLLIATTKVVGTLLWAGAVRGIGIHVGWWWRVVPHIAFDVDGSQFVRLVTLSSWLGGLGMVAAVVWWFAARWRRSSRSPAVEDHAERQDQAFASFVRGSAGVGAWIGLLLGCCTLIVTIILELLRDRFVGAYVLPLPHIWLLSLALLPILGLVATSVSRPSRRQTLRVESVRETLEHGGVIVTSEEDQDVESSSYQSDRPFLSSTGTKRPVSA